MTQPTQAVAASAPPRLALECRLRGARWPRVLTVKLTPGDMVVAFIHTRTRLHDGTGDMLAYASVRLPQAELLPPDRTRGMSGALRVGTCWFDLTEQEYRRVYELFVPRGLKVLR